MMYFLRRFFWVLMVICGVVCAANIPGEDFVKIPANPEFSFTRSPESRGPCPHPGEKSPITKSYYMARYPVTNVEYAAFCRATDYVTPRYWENGRVPVGKERHPVLWVTVKDVEAYCRYMEKKHPGWHFRLPTEAEWENAAMGPSKTTFPWGNIDGVSLRNGKLTAPFNFNAVVAAYFLKASPDALVQFTNEKSPRFGEKVPLNQVISVAPDGRVRGWINHTDFTGFVYCDLFKEILRTGGYTTPVDAHPEGKSAYGCMDMVGNAWEWTSTSIVASNGAERGQIVNAIRGGSWYANKNSCRADFRGEGRFPDHGFNSVGFRLVAEKSTDTAK